MLTIYGLPISVHTRKVIIAAIEKNLDHEIEMVIPFDPPANWDKLSPTGLIPAVKFDDGTTLADSTVICTYLDRIYPDHPMYPSDPKELAKALWLEEYGDGTLFRNVVHGLFAQKVIRPNILKEETDQAEVDRILTDVMPKMFGYFENQIDGPYLVGGKFTIADITLASNLLNYQYLGLPIDEARFPKLANYFRQIIEHPSLKQHIAAEQPAAQQMGLDSSFLH